MSILLFEQWDKLVSLLQKIASGAAAEKSQYALNRVIPEGGHAQLMDRAMNNLTLNGEEVMLHVPDMIPGKVRDFLVRMAAEAYGITGSTASVEAILSSIRMNRLTSCLALTASWCNGNNRAKQKHPKTWESFRAVYKSQFEEV